MQFEARGSKLIAITNEGETPFCEAIYVDSVDIDMASGEKIWHVFLHDKAVGPRYVVVKRGVSSRVLINTLRKAGLTCPDDEETCLVLANYLYETEDDAKQRLLYRNLGYQVIPFTGERVYLAHHPVGVIGNGKINAMHADAQKTKPEGTFRAWRRGIRDCVLGRSNMELVLALSAMPPVAHILREEQVVQDVPVISFIGPSSSGKTLNERVIASVYGKSTISSGIIEDYHCTQTAFYARMGGNFGWPIILDESTSKSDEWPMGSILYTLVNGKDKLRSDSSGRPRTPETFSGVVFTSGEVSLLKNAKTPGLLARVLEFSLPWTMGEKHAGALERVVLNNYGHAVYPLVKWLNGREQWLVKEYKAIYAELIKEYGSTRGINNRILKVHALIVLSALVVSKAWGFPLYIQGIYKTLSKLFEQHLKNTNKVELAYLTIKDFIITQHSYFHQGNSKDIASNAWGFIGKHKGRSAAWIPTTTLEGQIRSKCNIEIANLAKAFIERGYIYEDGSRHTKFKKNFGTIETPCYILYLEDDVGAVGAQKVKKAVVNSKLKLLLDDSEDKAS